MSRPFSLEDDDDLALHGPGLDLDRGAVTVADANNSLLSKASEFNENSLRGDRAGRPVSVSSELASFQQVR